jgi:hypothetical protein
MVKKVAITLGILLLFIQFIRPHRNQMEGISENDISNVYDVPVKVQQVLTQKCYDCHSNNTRYPWYTNIQPVGWWMASHVNEGKEHLNFSEFKTYNEKRAKHKLEELSEAVTDGWMPLESYLWIHQEAKVTAEETKAINDWIASLGVKVKSE